MKKILILVSFLTLSTLSLQSQRYSFVLDTIQPFKCPSNLDVNEPHRLGIGNEKGTNRKIVIVTALDEDITIQKGYFGYPMDYTINPSTQ